MEIFLDSASCFDIERFAPFIDGVTTNPSLMAKEDRKISDVVHDIVKLVKGPISVEVAAGTAKDMISEAHQFRKISEYVVIKLPITMDGLIACKELSNDGIPTNMTLCFSANQAIMAAKCNATYVSPFIGRLDDSGHSGLTLIEEIRDIFYNFFDTKILAASIRSLDHITEAARIGVDAITIPPKILEKMWLHPLTDVGLEIFERDAKKNA